MRRLVINSILISMAIILSYVERLIPVGIVIPLPGIKLGLANIITIFALFYLDIKAAVTINLLRCAISSLLFGGLMTFFFSFTGAMASLLVMILLKKGYEKYFSIIGISIAGAAAHNVGQLLLAYIILKSGGVFGYLTLLLLASLVTGLLTAVVAGSIISHMNNVLLGEVPIIAQRFKEEKRIKSMVK